MLERAYSDKKTAMACRMFRIAWGFLVITAALGLLLRVQQLWPIKGVDYANVLHAHSHIGFLGWVFNAFFALAFFSWASVGKERSWWCLFWLLQLANVGMLLSFPLQGYGGISILFTTLHMIGSLSFAWKLWRNGEVSALARPWMSAALVMMLLSGLGPLALGPLAAMDLRASPAYSLSIYWYLHFQYNGWFVLFPAAWIIHLLTPHLQHQAADLKRALALSLSGILITYLVSALWLDLPSWLVALTAAGGGLQLTGMIWLLCILWPECRRFLRNAPALVRMLILVGVGVLVLKNGAQLLACLPELEPYVQHRFVVIAFLHLIFLAVVLPWMVAVAREMNWMRGRGIFTIGALLLGTGVVTTKIALIFPLFPTEWNSLVLLHHGAVLFWAALVKWIGAVILMLTLFRIRH